MLYLRKEHIQATCHNHASLKIGNVCNSDTMVYNNPGANNLRTNTHGITIVSPTSVDIHCAHLEIFRGKVCKALNK